MQRDYRKDIDGLRCLAVLLVFFYHLGVKYTPAGFIGVDIFFVISGFLITQHIIAEIDRGVFSLKHFYLKRMRRILPALVLVVFVTIIAAYFILLPEPLKSCVGSGLAALLSFSNIYFYKFIQVGYFATDASILPLLHTWSLGIEEQFYIIWPLLLLVMARYFSKRGFFFLSVICCFFSFMLYAIFRAQVVAVYYLPITRAFELLIGAIVAVTWSSLLNFSYGAWVDHLLSIIAIMLILYAGCFLSIENYPGFYALLPCIGAAVLIYTGRGQHSMPVGNQLLSLRPFVFIGLISYSLYLWHWPAIAFLNAFNIPIGFYLGMSLFVVTIFLATLSWYFIELPCRFSFQFGFLKTLLVYFFIPVVLLGGFKLFLVQHPFLGFNTVSPNIYQLVNNFNGPLDDQKCFQTKGRTLPLEKLCSVGDSTLHKSQVLIVGDSHAMAYAGMLDVWLKNKNLKGYLVTQNATPFLIGIKWLEKEKADRSKSISEIILAHHYQYVVMGASWSSYSDATLKGYFDWSKGWFGGAVDEMWGVINNSNNSYTVLKAGLDSAIQMILKTGAVPVIFLDYPPLLNVSVYCGFTRFSHDVKQCYNVKDHINAMQYQSRMLILHLQKHYPQVILLDPRQLICDSQRCFSSINNMPLYYDGGKNSHLNYEASRFIGKHYANPFLYVER